MATKYKHIKHYHEPGDVHELTFSCYHCMPLLTNDTWRQYLADSLTSACAAHAFRLVAFVFMPEHLHLIVLPEKNDPKLGVFLAAVKSPCSAQVKADLVAAKSSLLERLTVCERPGKTTFRFWQEGPGHDRNLQHDRSALASIDYVHNNPVRRGLCESAAEWLWSSAAFYATDPPKQDSRLPIVHGLPPEFFDVHQSN